MGTSHAERHEYSYSEVSVAVRRRRVASRTGTRDAIHAIATAIAPSGSAAAMLSQRAADFTS
jgi:hypothetical protein